MGQAFPALRRAAQRSSISPHPMSWQGCMSTPGDGEQGLEREILAFKPHTCLGSSHLLCVSVCHRNSTSPWDSNGTVLDSAQQGAFSPILS